MLRTDNHPTDLFAAGTAVQVFGVREEEVGYEGTRFTGFTRENPIAPDNALIMRVPYPITITKVIYTLQGSVSPSVTLNLKHGTDASNPTDNLHLTNQTITNTTTGTTYTTFADPTLAANEMLVLAISAVSGIVTQVNVSIEYSINP